MDLILGNKMILTLPLNLGNLLLLLNHCLLLRNWGAYEYLRVLNLRSAN